MSNWRQRSCAFGLVLVGLVVAQGAPLDGRPPVDDVFYQFMPIAWRDSDHDTYRFGDFGGMTASLDYLQQLGVTAVWMNPIFPSPAYHGYQHGAGDQMNPWFGTETDFLNFVQAAHARGIKVFIDFVEYGISQNSTWFQSAYNNPSSPYDNWLGFTNSANTQYTGSVYTTWNGSQVGFIYWNLNDPNPAALVTGWSQHWLDPNGDGDPSDGIDGYRLDHVLPNGEIGPNGWGYTIADFWIPWKNALKAVNPDVFTFAEQGDWGNYGVDLLPAHDATMTKPFEFAARSALADETSAGLYSEMEVAVASLPAGHLFVGIIGDHDVDRLASTIGDSLQKGRAAAAVLLTQPFPPIIYYGDEIGMRGTKASYSGDAADIPMREPFKWTAQAAWPMSNYFVLNSQAYNNRVEQNNDGRSVEEQLGVSGSLLEAYRLLIATRKDNIALRRGTYDSIPNSNTHVWAFLRHHADQTVIVAINVSGSTRSFNLNMTDFTLPAGSTTPVDVITGASLTPITEANKANYPLSLTAYNYRILAVTVDPPAPPPAGIDGRDIPTDCGPVAVATQNNATALGDNVSELDQLFITTQGDALRIGLTGNLATDGTGLALFFDTVAGGQNVLDFSNAPTPPNGPEQLTGLRFDAGFIPDQMVFVNAYSGTIYVDQYQLLTAGGVSKTYRGQGTVNDGDGYLTGGTNPHAMQAALDNTNTAGVTATDASGAATATTGFELLIPYADIGLPSGATGAIGVAGFLLRTNGTVSNQWLPGLGGGYANLGVAPNLTTIPGNQYVQLLLNPVGDMNCDGVVNNQDIDGFVQALFDPAGYTASHPNCDVLHADFNSDGVVNNQDIDGFVLALFGG